MVQGLRRLTVALTLLSGIAGAAGAPAEPLTIQGSSTFASGILVPNQSTIEKRSGQSLKIVGVRSDIGLPAIAGAPIRVRNHFDTAASRDRIRAKQRREFAIQGFDRLPDFQGARCIRGQSEQSNTQGEPALKQVLSGDLTNWKQLGGADEAIRVVYVDGGDGVTLSVAEELFGTRSFAPADPIRVNFSSQVVKVVEQEPRALGVTQLGLTRDHHLPELATDRVIEQELSLVTLGKPSPAQQAVIDAIRKVAAKASAVQ
jgi:phosphate transport system substrate-binding protein